MIARPKSQNLTDEQRIAWLQLIRSENVGAITFWSLINHYGNAQDALQALPQLANKRAIRIAKRSDIEREIANAQKANIRYICASEPDYPHLLREMEGAPPVISVRGQMIARDCNSVGVVGSRNASAAGIKLAASFAQKLGQQGFNIVSGLARGIDSAAHSASIKTGTIAVMAGGINKIYPPENTRLYEEIINNGGMILSEMPFNWTPRAVDFPRRNRLVAGLSLGLLVVEAAQRSGSLISARLASEMGRVVFAIPGSPLDPRASGTNNLIKNGASLVTEPEDIIETLTPLTPNEVKGQLSFFESPTPGYKAYEEAKHRDPAGAEAPLTPAIRARILAALSTTPIDLETILQHADITLPELYLALVELDMSGQIIRHAGGLVSLSPQ